MGQNGRIPRTGLTADEFCARFQTDARVLWTLAAGLLGDPTEAEDVCQEAFLAAYAKCDQFEPGTDFLAWMGRFVRNVSANELRKRARRRTASTDPVLLDQDAGGSPTEAAVRLGSLAFYERLLAGLDELGEVPRACLLLRSLRVLSHAEIAALLSIPEGTAMSHFHRARVFLRAKLDPAFHGAQP